jgi:superfamily I DNA/RNA helicase
MIRSLALSIPSDGSLTFFGDMAQQIYGNNISWRMAGLKPLENYIWQFRENYRNTRQIANLCIAMTNTEAFRDTSDLIVPNEPVADGPLPTLVHCSSIDIERRLVIATALSLSRTQSVGIFVRRREDEEPYLRALKGTSIQYLGRDLTSWSPIGISIGSYHSAKGFEFDTVILPNCSDNYLPDKEFLSGFIDRDEGITQEARLIYVGLSRARSRLIITYTGNITSLLPFDPSLYTLEKR